MQIEDLQVFFKAYFVLIKICLKQRQRSSCFPQSCCPYHLHHKHFQFCFVLWFIETGVYSRKQDLVPCYSTLPMLESHRKPLPLNCRGINISCNIFSAFSVSFAFNYKLNHKTKAEICRSISYSGLHFSEGCTCYKKRLMSLF